MVEFEFLVSVPAVVGITQAVKTAVGMDGRWAFAVSIVVGIVLAVLAGWAGDGGLEPSAVVDGLIVGLSAAGLYSGTTTSAGSLRRADPVVELRDFGD